MKKFAILSVLVLVFFSYVFAANAVEDTKEPELTLMQQQARDYREEGLKMQDMGNLDEALAKYQKAIVYDPEYPVVYNDLGVLYETKGMPERAEESYLKAIRLDPYYLSTYSNLALFYESKRDLSKAAYCWKKRAELGQVNDPWTQKARQRLEDIRVVLSDRPIADVQEKEVVGLAKEVKDEKIVTRYDDKELAKSKLKSAKSSYIKEDYATAMKEASDAQYLDPNNKEIEEFVERTQSRALAR